MFQIVNTPNIRIQSACPKLPSLLQDIHFQVTGDQALKCKAIKKMKICLLKHALYGLCHDDVKCFLDTRMYQKDTRMYQKT